MATQHVLQPNELSADTMGTPTPSISSIRLATEAWLSLLKAVEHVPASRLVYSLVFKRGIDLVVALCALIVLSPVLLIIAVTIRLSTGTPAVFRQVRVGKNGHPFVVYKFCTMIPERRRVETSYDGVERRVQHKAKGDPRITKIGRILRATSLDELPQLVNIVRGDMSLVGPRPELTNIVAHYAPWQHQRHLVRPGLTGWWQIQGRSELPMHLNTELDIYYVENQSFGLDVRIILRTVIIVLRGAGAY